MQSTVTVEVVETDQAAYALDEAVHASVTVVNQGIEPVAARLTWTVEYDARRGETVSRLVEAVQLDAKERRVIRHEEPLETEGITRLGRVRVQADVDGLRGDAARVPFVMLPAPVDPPALALPRKVFAHYMGCYPVGIGSTRHHQLNTGNAMRHDHPSDDLSRRGGRFRNFPLVPWDPALTLEQSADLEIRRAMRVGIDGFAVDAWAGGDGAKEVMDALIRVAEEKDYPFEITICLDPACGAHLVDTVREVLERWGDSPKLARRNGKPLIVGYFSHAFAMGTLHDAIDDRTPVAQHENAVYRLRTTELGWHLIGQTYRKAEEQVGQPIFYHYDLIYFFIEWWRHGEPPAVERDRVYLTYAKYPKDARAWPFSIRIRSDRALEVLTILTAPATVRLPGRDIEYDALAGRLW